MHCQKLPPHNNPKLVLHIKSSSIVDMRYQTAFLAFCRVNELCAEESQTRSPAQFGALKGREIKVFEQWTGGLRDVMGHTALQKGSLP